MELLKLEGEDEYQKLFKKQYIEKQIRTVDGFKISFKAERFKHAFYTCSSANCFNHRHDWKCDKDLFDTKRAERILWIGKILRGEIKATVLEGKDPKDRKQKRYYIYHESEDPFAIVLRKTRDNFAFTTAFCPQEDWIRKIERFNKKINPEKEK